MPRQEATKQVGVRIPKEYFATIQAVAELKGQDNSTVINELIFEAMPRMQSWLADQIGVRMLAFRLALAYLEPRPSDFQVELMQCLARMIPERTLAADAAEELQQRFHRVMEDQDRPSDGKEKEKRLSSEKASEFFLRMLNLEDDLCRRLTATPGRKGRGSPQSER